MIAATLQTWFGGDIRIWYFVCVAYALPLAFGGVRNWLDRLNGSLLPLCCVGLGIIIQNQRRNRCLLCVYSTP